MQKLDDFRKTLPEQVDAVLLFDEINQYYFTGYKFTDGIVLITRENAYLVTDFRYYEEALNCTSDFEVVMPAAHFDFVKDVLQAQGCKCIGIEGNIISHRMYNKVVDTFSMEVFDISSFISSALILLISLCV